MKKIQDFIHERHKYVVDMTYQRPADAWSKEDKQCLIDTIISGEPMPIFFMNYKEDEGKFYIVDGQQRLQAIKEFYDNKIKLNKKFSGIELHNKTFNSTNPLDDENRNRFLNYDLTFKILEDYNDEKIRMIFSRLQRGKPLQLGERLNALPGDTVMRMREIAEHPFMKHSIGINKSRYGNYPDAARILYYVKLKNKNCGSKELYAFFDTYPNIQKNDTDYKDAINTLNYLSRCFPSNPGDYKFIEKHAWVYTIFTAIHDLKLLYSFKNKENEVFTFTERFHGKIYDESFRTSNTDYQRFYDNVRGGWSEKIITLRREIYKKELLNKLSLKELSDRRQISDEEKIKLFNRNKKACQLCKKRLKDYRDAEYHHIELYSEGGSTDGKNIAILCSTCHDNIHANPDILLPSEEEYVEVE